MFVTLNSLIFVSSGMGLHHHHHHSIGGHVHDHAHGEDMGHDHHHGEDLSSRKIAIAFWLNFGFTLMEIVGGILTNSMAVLSDALHDIGDSLSLGLAWYFQGLSQKGVDNKYTYGYRRFSVLGALLNVVILTTGSVVIMYLSIRRLIHPEEVEPLGMVGMAILGIAINGAAVWQLRGSDGLNTRVVALHLLEDVLGWVAVLIGSVIMLFVDAPWIDPLLSILITSYILYHAIRNMIRALAIIMQKVPAGVDLEKIKAQLEELPELLDAHDLHIWSLDGRFMVMTLHAQVAADKTLMELEQIKFKIHAEMRKFGIQHVTVEFEPAGVDCIGCGKDGKTHKALRSGKDHAH